MNWEELIAKIQNNLTPEQLAQPAQVLVPGQSSPTPVYDLNFDGPQPYMTLE